MLNRPPSPLKVDACRLPFIVLINDADRLIAVPSRLIQAAAKAKALPIVLLLFNALNWPLR